MLTHRGFSAWLVSGEETIQEHLVAVDEHNNRVSCWVPSEPGRTFALYWQDHGGGIDTCAFITLDGFVVPGRFLFGSGVASRQGVRTGNATERPFVFSKVEEMTHEPFAGSAANEMGMIILRIKRIERVGGRPANEIQNVPDTMMGNRAPGEHCITFGNEQAAYSQYSTTWAVKPSPMDRPCSDQPSTYVTFVFRYRSPEFLKAQGIISDIRNPHMLQRTQIRRVASAPAGSNAPLTPSPSPRPRQRDLSSSVMQALSYGTPRSRKTPDARRVMSLRGVPVQNNIFPGQGLVQFDNRPLGWEPEGDARHDYIVEDSEDGS